MHYGEIKNSYLIRFGMTAAGDIPSNLVDSAAVVLRHAPEDNKRKSESCWVFILYF